MSWRGRKRDTTRERYPCGKPKRLPPSQPHRKTHSNNPLAATTHGRYLLDGLITPAQHVAGELFSRDRARYRAAMGAPDSLRSRDEGHPGEGREPRDDARVVADFEALRAELGRRYVDVEWVCVQDAMLADLTAYREGLDILRRIYRV